MKQRIFDIRSAGYTYLLEILEISGVPNWHCSFVSQTHTQSSKIQDAFVEETFRKQYWPGENIGNHLEFALKYDGINLGLLFLIFQATPVAELTEYIQSKPTGKYTRRIWFLYEFIMDKELSLENSVSGNYINILDPELYYTVQNGEKSARHRVINNFLGTVKFCPIIRKTETLSQMDNIDLRKRCEDIAIQYPPELLRRALNYLYNKETKSSFEIEKEKPNASRIEKFVSLLGLAEKEDFCTKKKLIDLQNWIVDPRFKDKDYRTEQNYVGQTISFQREVIHFISPKPEDISDLMSGLIETHNRMKMGGVSPIVHATVISYGFVFLHPFEDGNGRIHRFLIHNVLALQGLLPKGLMFPISATMLKNLAEYDASLESFSRPLLQFIDYHLDEMGQMEVENDTSHWYRYIDMTIQTEKMYGFVFKTIEEELVNELQFLANYDKTKNAIQEIIDMPDRKIDLFIQLCLHNNGTLSKRKKESFFSFLTLKEIEDMERAVRDGYEPSSK